MANVFFSYTRADKETAQRIVSGLRALGIGVIWDEDFPAADWQRLIVRHIDTTVATLVLWTPQSIEREAVLDEAEFAKEKDKLINVIHGVEKPPFGFRRMNGIPLNDWTATEPHHGWRVLIESIESRMKQLDPDAGPTFVARLQERDDAILAAKANVKRERETLDRARLEQTAATDRLSAAQAAVAHSFEDYAELERKGMAPRVLAAAQRAAQEEINAAQDGVRTAEQALRNAEAIVADAKVAVGSAEIQLQRFVPDSMPPKYTPTASPTPNPVPSPTPVPTPTPTPIPEVFSEPVVERRRKWPLVLAAIVLMVVVVSVLVWAATRPVSVDNGSVEVDKTIPKNPAPPVPAPPATPSGGAPLFGRDEAIAQAKKMDGWWNSTKLGGNDCLGAKASPLRIAFQEKSFSVYRQVDGSQTISDITTLADGWLVEWAGKRKYKFSPAGALLSKNAAKDTIIQTELARCPAGQAASLDARKQAGTWSSPSGRDAGNATDNAAATTTDASAQSQSGQASDNAAR